MSVVRDLLVTGHTPALGSGRALRTYGVVRALALHRPLDLLYVRFGPQQPGPEYRRLANVALAPIEPSRGTRRAVAYARARVRGVPPALARGVSPELRAAAGRRAQEPQRGRVIADSPTVAAALLGLAGGRPLATPVIYNAHNLESSFRHRSGGEGLGSRRALERFERRLLLAAAETWLPSHADVAAARELAPAARLRYVPNVVDVAAIAPVTPDSASGRILLVADFNYDPNRDALAFLTGEIMPMVWRELPEACVVVVGRGLNGWPAPDARVELRGFVEDLRGCYEQAACVAVPILEGGGSSLKFIEALAYGLPVVATPKAAAGLDARAESDYLQGTSAAQFAEKLVAVLRDGADGIARAGRALAEREYSVEALGRAIAP